MATAWSDLGPIVPACILLGGAIFIIGLDMVPRRGMRREILEYAAYGVVLAALLDLLFRFQVDPREGFGGGVIFDSLSLFMTITILAATALSLFLGQNLAGRAPILLSEFLALLLIASAGMILLVCARELVTLFLALELMSLPVYVLCGVTRFRSGSTEAAMKYFVIGAFASALLLYGFALLYGFSGTVFLQGIGHALASRPLTPTATLGLGLVLTGFAFKIGAVPFHVWVPDAYQGAPTAVTAFMSAGVKAAAFAALLRFLVEAAWGSRGIWIEVVGGVAVVTMLIGNLLALPQTNLKRMLAYSSVAHTGYILIGVAAVGAGNGSDPEHAHAVASVSFYLLAYAFMTLGSFAALILLGRGGEDAEELTSLDGMASRRPWVSLWLAVCLLSLAGLPPTGGFFAKFFIFKAALQLAERKPVLLWAVVAGIITTVLSLYYYLRPIATMYLKDGGCNEPETHGSRDSSVGATVFLCAVFAILLGVLPGNVLQMAYDLAARWLSGNLGPGGM